MKSIFPIKTMLGAEGFRSRTDDYTQLKNPITEIVGLHLGTVSTKREWEGSGQCARIRIDDDRNGGFTICVGEHKGAVYAWLEDVEMDNPWPDEYEQGMPREDDAA